MLIRTTIAALFLITGTLAVSARPLLDHASPAAGSAVRHSPSEIALSFTEILLPSGSDAVVRNSTGGVVSSGKARVVGNKAQMQVPVNSLAPGKYRVEWYATSVDRRQNQGSFNFFVGSKETVGQAAAPVHRAPSASSFRSPRGRTLKNHPTQGR
jgi:copper resistance protein C